MDIEAHLNNFELEYRNRIGTSTLKSYRSSIIQFMHHDEKVMEKVTKKDIRNWLTHITTENKYKPNTMNHKIAALKNFFSYCREDGFIEHNPAKDIRYIHVEEKMPCYLSLAELTKLRAFLKGKLLERALMEVLYATGVRITELLLMNKKDVNWDERYIVIPEGKGKVGRIVLFTLECAEHLKAYLESRTDELPSLFAVYTTEGVVTKHPNTVEEWYRYYKRSLGLTKLSPHTLRHTCAAHLAIKGMRLECIQQLLGHENFQTTKIYSQLHDSARKEQYDEWM